jgi:hypothetical protein
MNKLTVKILLLGLLVPFTLVTLMQVWDLISFELAGKLFATIWLVGGIGGSVSIFLQLLSDDHD